MNVKEIMQKWLKDNGYSALVNREGLDFCSCQIKSSKDNPAELFECEEYCGDCEPAYTIPCIRKEGKCDHCDADEGNKECFTVVKPRKEKGK